MTPKLAAQSAISVGVRAASKPSSSLGFNSTLVEIRVPRGLPSKSTAIPLWSAVGNPEIERQQRIFAQKGKSDPLMISMVTRRSVRALLRPAKAQVEFMRHSFPANPLEDYRAPSFAYGLKMRAALIIARLFRYWDTPSAIAATDEASFIDNAYWLHKCARPITKAEENVAEVIFLRDKSVVKLPDGFKSDASVTFAAAGDLMPADELELSKDILFENVADVLLNVDVSFANLEAPVTERDVKESEFVAGDAPIMGLSLAQFSALVGHRGKYFTALNFANNHAFDMGIEGLETTQKLLTQKGIVDVGTPRHPQEHGRAKILAKEGIKIGFISATYGLNRHDPPVDEAYRIHTAKLMSRSVPTELEILKEQIKDCKKQRCDFIVASIHWGYEFEFFPRYRQVDAAHTLIEEGVDLILGHHPHVIQPVEYYRTKRDPNRIAVIAYSLGGLTFDWYTAPHLVLGLILNMKLSRGLMSGAIRTYIESILSIPVFQSVCFEGQRKFKRIEKLQEHSNDRGTYHPARYVEQIEKYADLVLQNSK